MTFLFDLILNLLINQRNVTTQIDKKINERQLDNWHGISLFGKQNLAP